jgi:hypothetical protein
MSIRDRFLEFFDKPETKALVFRILWYVSLGMMVLGYLIIVYLIFTALQP